MILPLKIRHEISNCGLKKTFLFVHVRFAHLKFGTNLLLSDKDPMAEIYPVQPNPNPQPAAAFHKVLTQPSPALHATVFFFFFFLTRHLGAAFGRLGYVWNEGSSKPRPAPTLSSVVGHWATSLSACGEYCHPSLTITSLFDTSALPSAY